METTNGVMKLCNKLRSRSFLDFDLRSLKNQNYITISKIFFSETNWPITLKFLMEPPCIVALKFCLRYLGHMAKIATTLIYGKNFSKISRTDWPISMKLGM